MESNALALDVYWSPTLQLWAFLESNASALAVTKLRATKVNVGYHHIR
ncbi:MAG: hypothetical protein KAI83_18755 [Thiomargarita sp.]|nr:hypothetical protein [Thiomargarita sp.]